MDFYYSKSARISSYILGSLFFAGGIALIIYAFYSQLFLILIGIFLACVAWVAIREVRLSSLTLDDDSITLVNSRGFNMLPLKDIQGYRFSPKDVIEIVPVEGVGKKITISSSFEKRDEIKNWLQAHLTDLDEVTIQQETEAILADEQFGLSETDRTTHLQQAKQAAKVMNIVGYGVGLWALIYPSPYKILVTILMIVPFITLAVVWYFKGLLQLADGRKSAYPSVAGGILMPAFTLLIRALSDYSIYDYNTVFKPLLIIFFIASAITYIACQNAIKHATQKKATIISLLIYVGLYAYGTTIIVNAQFDKVPATVYTTNVLGKHIRSGKTTTYYLELNRWGRYTQPEDVSVSSGFYNSEEAGDKVDVYLKQGYLGIPWFIVDKTSE